MIGYSFPKTDVYFEHLLTLGLENNETLKEIVVINPDESINEDIKNMFDKLFFNKRVKIINNKFENIEFFFRQIVDENSLETTINDSLLHQGE